VTNEQSGRTPSDFARLRMARIAVSYSFLTFGLSLGVWFVHIPLVAARLALEPAVLGLALLCAGIGGLVSPPIAALLMTRIGSRIACQVMTAVIALFPAALIFAPNIIVFFIVTPFVGICGGALNVAANTQAAQVEGAYGRPVMSSFHGFFSLGGLVAAAIAGILFAAGLGDGRAALAIAAVLIAGTLILARSYLPDTARPSGGATGPLFVVPSKELLTVVLICFTCTLIEGSVGDWSALYLISVKLTTDAVATTGYAMFALAMTASRFAGNPIVARLGARTTVTWGGVLIIAGMLVVVFAPWGPVSAAGFLVVGLGAANISPVLISVASRMPGMAPSLSVAMVSSAQGVGLLLGPPIIGFVAQGFGLTIALGLAAILALVIALGPTLRPWATGAPSPA
jgi:MFS family permease